MLFMQMNTRVGTAIRLAALVLVSYSVLVATPAPGASGRGLVISITLGLAIASWLVWTARAWNAVPSVIEWPLAGEVLVLAVAGAVLTGASSNSAASAFVFVAVVAAGLRVDLRRALPVLGAGAFALAVSVVVFHGGALGVLAYSLGFVAALLAASNSRGSVLRAEQAELLLAQTQRSHEEQLRAVQLEESTRIAREIHDVLAHALAGLVIQLEATAVLLEQDADRDAVLARVRRAHELAREGLRETRRAVGALRGDRAERPVPVATAIESLLATHRDASDATVETTIDGALQALTADAAEVVVRVAQEALTNIRKHAPGAEVSLTLHAGDGVREPVVLVVADRRPEGPLGRSPTELAGSGGGFGVRGMRERAEGLGGTLAAGPADGGWRVELRLPAPERALVAEGVS